MSIEFEGGEAQKLIEIIHQLILSRNLTELETLIEIDVAISKHLGYGPFLLDDGKKPANTIVTTKGDYL